MEFSEKKAMLLNALIERRGLQYIVNVASQVMNNPIFVYDTSWKILAKSNSRPEDEETWAKLFPEGHLVFKDLLEVERAGIFAQLLNDDKPIFGSFAFFPHRFLGCRVRDKGSVVGIVTMVEINKAQAGDLELMVILSKCILFEMLYCGRTAMQRIPYFGLFKDLIEGNAQENEIQERLSSLRLTLPNYMRLLFIEYVSQKPGLSIYYARETLNSLLHSSYSFIYDDSILLLINDTCYNDTTISLISKSFAGIPIRIGVSRRFQNIMRLQEAYEQAKAAIRIYKKLASKSSLCLYDNIYIYHFFETASKEFDLRNFCDPLINCLENYDKKNHTCLKDTLEVYLESGRNIQIAAHQLHLHKNTLYYRIRKIEELCSTNLKDENVCFNLLFSFRILRIIS